MKRQPQVIGLFGVGLRRCRRAPIRFLDAAGNIGAKAQHHLNRLIPVVDRPCIFEQFESGEGFRNFKAVAQQLSGLDTFNFIRKLSTMLL